ncbi:interferon-induced very large GTPase 1-like isoform X2 [Mya arenaria]|uniref:interferon-induced very large GTPase 1-like isoform X2 n=1 Tax=Mya arenaria TaxID=6604 RepID=UPI0022E04AFF|nr:interferon-induced very large GTPase 1-like isoform X2 [Mya arenaria]
MIFILGVDPRHKRRETIFQIMDILGLEKHRLSDRKISVHDVIANGFSQRTGNPRDVVWILLNGILNANSDIRDSIGKICFSEEENRKPATKSRAMDLLTGSDTMECKELSPLDVFFVVFQCCDSRLRILIAKRLYMCKLAIPFMFDSFEENYKFMVSIWPMRTIAVQTVEKYSETRMFNSKSRLIAFARFGNTGSTSKSLLLNAVLSNENFPTFYNRECQSGMLKRNVSNGCMEIFFVPAFEEGGICTYVNLRGNINGDLEENCLQFIGKISDVLIILTRASYLSENLSKFENLVVGFGKTVVVFTDEKLNANEKIIKAFEGIDSLKYRGIPIDITDSHNKGVLKNTRAIATKLLDYIRDLPLSKSMSDRLKYQDLNTSILIDEKINESVIGRKQAYEVMVAMKIDLSHVESSEKHIRKNTFWKRAVTPGSYSYSREISRIIKRIHRKPNDEQNNSLISLRKEMVGKVSNGIKKLVQCFIEDKTKPIVLYFTFEWLSILIELETYPTLHDYTSLYVKVKQNNEAKKERVQNEVDDPIVVEEIKLADDFLKQIEANIQQASITVEHLFREIVHICDASIETEEYSEAIDKQSVHDIADAFSNEMLNCTSFEIIDSDTDFMPREWMRFVTSKACKKIPQSRIITVSVLGCQSVGKSTLLNLMFGTDFKVGSGCTTKGVHAQLVPIQDSNSGLPFQYIFVIDTEGLRNPETETVMGPNLRDKELATFVMGLADISLINIMGENPSYMKDILQEAVSILVRLYRTNKSLHVGTSCMFIHHNISESNVYAQTKEGIDNTIRNLDEVTRTAAENENMHTIKTFKDVIEFSASTDVLHVPTYLQGPLNRVNQAYSKRLSELKRTILEKSRNSRKLKSLEEVFTRADNLWEGLLAEDFVISFRNSLELKAYRDMQVKINTELANFESHYLEKYITITQTRFSQATCKKQLDIEKKNILEETRQHLLYTAEQSEVKTVESIYQKKAQEECEYTELIGKWKQGIQYRVHGCILEMIHDVKNTTDKLFDKRLMEIETSLPEDKNHKFIKRVTEEAAQLSSQHLTEALINDRFEACWSSYLSDIDLSQTTDHKVDLKAAFDRYFQIQYGCENSAEWLATHQKSQIDPETFTETVQLDENDFKLSKHFKSNCKMIVEGIRFKILALCSSECEVNKKDVNEFLAFMDSEIARFTSGGFEISDNFKMKLVTHFCHFALDRLNDHNDNFYSMNGTTAHIERFKRRMRSKFDSIVLNWTNKKTVAERFCDEIKTAIRKTIPVRLQTKQKQMVFEKMTDKGTFLLMIHTDLLEKDEFLEFDFYIQHPEISAERWFQTQCEKLLKDKEGICKFACDEIVLMFDEICTVLNNHFQRSHGDYVMSLDEWFTRILPGLAKYGLCKQQFSYFEKVFGKNIDDVKAFISLITSGDGFLNRCKKELQQEIQTKPVFCDSSLLFRKFSRIWGCLESCPFCGEPCRWETGHLHNEQKHSCFQHRPGCCKGNNFLKTDEACLEACNFNVQSNISFNCETAGNICGPECTEKWHKFKEYKKLFQDWDISPSTDTHNSSVYWKWFVVHFKKELQEKYDLKLGNIPESWTKIKKTQAKRSLKSDYCI